ncbi:D-alanyl-D-alanine carboxypeptidase family protein [Virgibacillus ihumii]|uniref:D-alanyl-D-alanine carboxypeptidase family protein n=1 Tax=Virgibacillus ihumii TaxID=2686091 RepID=UPI001FE374D3|nr:D-alanyl-D-alanine carboxypeptidase family protein [Virgibacillus ihumii]
MYFKRLGLLFVTVLVCLFLASCDSNQQTASDEENTETAEEKNDSDVNQSNKKEAQSDHPDKANDSSSKSDSGDKNEKDSDNGEDSSKESDRENSKENSNTEPAEPENQDKSGNKHKSEEKLLPDVILELDDSGSEVKKVQQTLNKIGYSLSLNSKFDWSMVWVIKDFQAQFPALKTDGIYGPETRKYIKKAVNGKINVNPGSGMADSTDQTNNDTNENSNENERNNQNQSQVVSNPSSILVLVNKNNRLPENYIPKNLVVPNVRFPFNADLPKRQMRQVAANALENMFHAADQDGVDLFAQSGYRSYDRQEAIFAANAREHGREAANQFSAQAGESEHQTGLTMDVTSPDINYRLTTAFANTDEGKWVKKHASEYGFIIRYPKGKTAITGYQYEPWHLRYVGKEAAQAIDRQNITLEQYLGAV